jgi:hypothetical protein
MNFLGHAEVARRHAGDDPHFLLGAVLPDLVPMLGVTIDREGLHPRVADGWRSHHAVDEAFHQLPVFLLGVRALRDDLDLERGPRRAVAHVGWELLLDDVVDERAFRLALTVAPPEIADRFTGARPPVAERVWRAVGRRPRLAFDRARLDHVAEVLARHAPSVQATATEVLAALSPEVA